ncbi:MAG TPA: TlpA disulfide reductase family protein [Gemmataceae bacterium]|nr:TlpA disulfide reductase family protein [Gemmataceae bacterium]
MQSTSLLTMILMLQTGGQASDAKVDVKIVKFESLTQAIKASKSKFTVAYCWAIYDAPAKAAFPGIAKMQAKLKEKSVALIAVNVNGGTKQEERVRQFLTESKVRFPNFILDEDAEGWSTKLAIGAEPAFVIFDENGKRIASFDATLQEDLIPAVEKKLEALLGKK